MTTTVAAAPPIKSPLFERFGKITGSSSTLAAAGLGFGGRGVWTATGLACLGRADAGGADRADTGGGGVGAAGVACGAGDGGIAGAGAGAAIMVAGRPSTMPAAASAGIVASLIVAPASSDPSTWAALISSWTGGRETGGPDTGGAGGSTIVFPELAPLGAPSSSSSPAENLAPAEKGASSNCQTGTNAEANRSASSALSAEASPGRSPLPLAVPACGTSRSAESDMVSSQHTAPPRHGRKLHEGA
jgi:hypothetical protein